MWVTSSTSKILKPTSIALGNFDGIHRGHQEVVRPILQDDYYATVVSFNPHPREFFSGQTRKLLTPLDEKIQQLEALGVEQLILLPFDRQLASLSAEQFVEDILIQQLQVKRISVGEDFRFGHQRSGTIEDLGKIAEKLEIPVHFIPLLMCQNERISSSNIRQALEQGDLATANRLLGRPYSLTGLVIQGQQLGRKIGFPTANLQLPSQKFLPRYGVYAVQVLLNNSWIHSDTTLFSAVMNIGCRPTVEGSDLSIEVHLLNWSGDLYDQTVTVYLCHFLRSEQKFDSLSALTQQINIDCQLAETLLQSS